MPELMGMPRNAETDHIKTASNIKQYNGIKEFFKSNDEIDVMQKKMQEEILIETAAKVSSELGEGVSSKADARILLSAPLIKSHSKEVIGEGGEANRLVEAAKEFVERVLNQDDVSSGLKSSWREYVKAFRTWQRPDKKHLLDKLIADYCAWNEILSSFEGQTLSEWQPYVRAHQANIHHQIARIGGKKALAQLHNVDGKTIDNSKESSRSKNFGNLKIVHEMMLDPTYASTKLFETSTFETSLEASIALIKTRPELIPDLAMALVQDAERQLLLLIPEASSIVDRVHAVIDLDIFEQSLRHTSDPSIQLVEVQRKFASITTLMSEMCAPVRDDAVHSIARSISDNFSVDTFEGITCELWKLLKMMRQDMASFGLANIQPVLLKTAVEYELNNFHKRHEHVNKTRNWINSSMKRDTSVNSIWSDAMARLFEDGLNEDAWPETLELDLERIQGWRREMLDELLLQTQELLSRQNRHPGGVALGEDPVYILLKNRKLEGMRREFEAATLRNGKVGSKLGAFAKYHWAIHSGTYLQLQKEFEQGNE